MYVANGTSEQVLCIICTYSGTLVQSKHFGDIVSTISPRVTPTEFDGLPVVISKMHVTAYASKSTAHHAPVLGNLQSKTDLH